MKLTDNAKATVLICSHLAINSNEVYPFSTLQWNSLAEKLLSSDIKEPANLFGLDSIDIKNKLNITMSDAERIVKLLSRGANIAFCLDELERKSIYIVTRSDNEYPYRIRKVLGKNAPSLLYYCGDLSLTSKVGIAVVGSRDIDLEGEQFAQQIVNKATAEGFIVYSGGAKGVDQISEKTALMNGSMCVSFLADSMVKKIKLKENRDSISEGKLLLLSAVNPDTPFNVANAMNRNKYVYALSRSAFVIASDYNRGGTWAGAIENINHKWVNTYVWQNSKYKGNLQLIQKGAFGISNLDSLTISSLINRKPDLESEQINFFSSNINNTKTTREIDSKEIKVQNVIGQNVKQQEDAIKKSIYDVVLPIILDFLVEPKTLDEISDGLHVVKKQISLWLDMAINENIISKTKSPVKYYKNPA